MEKGLTVAEAAKRAGKSRPTIYDWLYRDWLELNDNNEITVESLQRIIDNPPQKGRPTGTFKKKREEK